MSMTVNELYSEIGIQSPMIDIWAEIKVNKCGGYGNYADVILCAYVDGAPEYEKEHKEAQP